MVLAITPLPDRQLLEVSIRVMFVSRVLCPEM
jgi:hypothetical protein